MFNWLFDNFLIKSIILPVVDVLLLAIIIYRVYKIFLQTRAVQLIRGLFFIVALYALANVLRLQVVLWILNFLGPGLVIAIAIIFQPELRKMFIQLGQSRLFRFKRTVDSLEIDEVLKAAQILADRRRGALMVFVRNVGQKNIIETGHRINAILSSALLVSIFGHDTPLHDGAVVIEHGYLLAAGVFLPLSERQDIRQSSGTRHRAALGLAEETDAVVLIVSEETGTLSLAYDASLHYDLEFSEVHSRLQDLLHLANEEFEK